MKPTLKIIVLLVVLAGGVFCYLRFARSPSKAAQAYMAFGSALGNRKFDEAQGMAAGPAIVALERKKKRYYRMVNFVGGQNISDVTGVEHEIKSEEVLEEGQKVKIEAIQTVLKWNRHRHDAMRAEFAAKYHHAVELHNINGAWKVFLFTEKELKE